MSTRILSSIDFRMKSGDRIACIGVSGSGKSTLLMAAAGLIGYNGRIALQGRDIQDALKKDPRWFHRRIGMATQFPERGFFAATVEDELAFTSRLLRLDDAVTKDRIRWVLPRVGLSDAHRARSPFSLSGGEKRRVALAVALLHDPAVVLLDEPDAGLDWQGKSLVADLILQMADRGRSFIVATHDVGWACQWANRIALLERGRLDACFDVTEALPSTFRRWLFDQGAADALFRRLKEVGVDVAYPYRNEWQFFRDVGEWLRIRDRHRIHHDGCLG